MRNKSVFAVESDNTASATRSIASDDSLLSTKTISGGTGVVEPRDSLLDLLADLFRVLSKMPPIPTPDIAVAFSRKGRSRVIGLAKR
jgi:hypothetical protein